MAKHKWDFATSYDIFSSFREALSLKSLKDFFFARREGIFTFSCSESVLTSLRTLSDGDVAGKGSCVCCVNDLRSFRGWTTAVATRPEVLNRFGILVGASSVLGGCVMGFLILALELFVFFARLSRMSAVSTSLWNVALKYRARIGNIHTFPSPSSPSPLALRQRHRLWLAHNSLQLRLTALCTLNILL
jgi:hypothetical protein